MKIRIRENTLRIRITQSELKQIAVGELVFSTIKFPGGTKLSYGLYPSVKESTSIRYQQNNIEIELGQLDQATLRDEQSVGIQSVHQAGEHTLELLIEKDFSCLHLRAKEDYDTFPNPNKKELG